MFGQQISKYCISISICLFCQSFFVSLFICFDGFSLYAIFHSKLFFHSFFIFILHNFPQSSIYPYFIYIQSFFFYSFLPFWFSSKVLPLSLFWHFFHFYLFFVSVCFILSILAFILSFFIVCLIVTFFFQTLIPSLFLFRIVSIFRFWSLSIPVIILAHLKVCDAKRGKCCNKENLVTLLK